MRAEIKFLIGMVVVTALVICAGMFFLGGGGGKQDEAMAVDINSVISDGRNSTGNPNAPVKIVEFGDFQCGACATAAPIVEKVIQENSVKVLFVFRHYPLPIHNNAMVSSQAAEAAGLQGKFMEMYKLLYERQKDWASSKNAEEIFEKYAGEIGLDVAKYKEDFRNAIGTVNKDYASGNKLGVSSTPTFFVNGQKYVGVLSEEKFRQIIAGAR